MKMTNETFNKLRFWIEIVGYVLIFIASCTELIDFKYSGLITGIIAAANILLGNILTASRKVYETEKGEEDDGVNE